MAIFKLHKAHSSTHENTYIHSGRGGAGNFFKAPPTTSSLAHDPTSLFTQDHDLPPSTSSTAKISSGRGGAGNMHTAREIASVHDIDEELRRRTTKISARSMVGAHHVGRGGAGNWAVECDEVEGSRNGRSSQEGRASNEGRRSGIFGRLSGSFDRR